jgi:hypothetical protein
MGDVRMWPKGLRVLTKKNLHSFNLDSSAVDLGYLEQTHGVFSLLDRVSRLITGLHKKVFNERIAAS